MFTEILIPLTQDIAKGQGALQIYFENTEGRHNKFYLLNIKREPSGYEIHRQWGRIGAYGCVLINHTEDWEEARRLLSELCVRRLRHGYVPVYGQPILSDQAWRKYGKQCIVTRKSRRAAGKQQLRLPLACKEEQN